MRWIVALPCCIALVSLQALSVSGSSGLVLHYDFNTDDGNVAMDRSGSGNHGEIFGCQYVPDGEGGLYEFNGISDYMRVPESPSLTITGSLSVAVWFKSHGYERQRPIVEWNRSEGSLGAGPHVWVGTWGYQWQGKGAGANLIDVSGDDISYVISTANPPAHEWHHMVVTYDSVSGLAELYLNSKRVQQKSMGTIIPRTDSDLYIGTRPGLAHDLFFGQIADIRIYNLALSSNEVRSLFTEATNHVPVIGKITARIEPMAARAEGAKWRVTHGPETNWNESGTTLLNIPHGEYIMTFSDLAGWDTPSDINVSVQAGETSSATGVYTASDGGTNTLVLYYDFNANGGDAVHDLSGYNNHGTVMGAKFMETVCGGVYEFNGIADHILVPTSSSLALSNSLSMAAWFRVYNYNLQRPILEWTDDSSIGVHLWTGTWGIQWGGKGTGANLIDITQNENSYVISTANPQANQWHHLAVTYDRPTGTARVYLNGVLRSEQNIGVFTPHTRGDLTIGMRHSQTDARFLGLLDEIRVYKGAISSNDVYDLYESYEPCREAVGSVTCTIDPSQARDAGAKWRLTSGPFTQWNNSGDVVANLPPGSYTLEFSNLTGWITPDSQVIEVVDGALISAGATYIPADAVPKTLVLHYDFNADDGTTVMDLSGHGNHGVLTGGTFIEADWGGMMQFDGTNDFIFVPASPSLDVAGSLTLATWFKTDSYTYQRPILEWNNGQGRSGVHMWTGTWGYQWQGKGTGANLIDTTGNEVSYVISTANPAVQNWHHLVVTYDRAIGMARVYLNGILANERFIGERSPQTSYDLYIGRRPGMALHGFLGQLDDIRIYAGALSAADVYGLFQGEGSGVPPAASLTCYIEPAGARNAGARWRLTSGDAIWHESGKTLSDLAEQSSSITFSEIPGWNSPADVPVTLSHGSNTTVSGSYTLDETDDIPPVIVSIRPPDGSVGLAHSAAMVVTVTDNVEVVRVTMNGQDAHTSNGRIWNFDMTGIRGSYNRVEIIATDQAGNQTFQAVNYAHSYRVTLASMWDGYWRIANPYTNDFDYTWDVAGSPENGSGTAPASSHHYFTTSPGPKTVRLYDGDGQLVDVANSHQAPPQPEGLHDGSLDSDNDGMTNYDKELAGLNINDPFTTFKLAAAFTADTGLVEYSRWMAFSDDPMTEGIAFTWQSGVDSIYTIEGTTDLVHWFPMPDFIKVPGTGTTMSYTLQNYNPRILMIRLKAEKMP